jgi:hypothetical protein
MYTPQSSYINKAVEPEIITLPKLSSIPWNDIVNKPIENIALSLNTLESVKTLNNFENHHVSQENRN